MELANLWTRGRGNPAGVRVATKTDAGAIMRLLQTAVHTHFHVDWHLPGDWIGSPSFVVVPKVEEANEGGGLTAVLFQNRSDITACFAATADPHPAAWVRVAALSEATNTAQTLADMLAQVVPALHEQGISQLAWLTAEEWPQPYMADLGFYVGSEIETYVKEDRQLPEARKIDGLTIRQAYSTDLDTLAELEAAAFAPMWRHSSHALAVARPQSLSFDVALLDDEIVAYQLSAKAESGAHLVRITVDPEKQRLGIGSALFLHAFAGYYRQGYTTVSLNTQVENVASQKLYLKFGFKASQQRLPIWMMDIS